MRLDDWEATIRTIVDECNRQETEYSRNKTLMKWRAKLGKEQNSMEAYQIDEIIREARRGLSQLAR
jgi:hypothetical protein